MGLLPWLSIGSGWHCKSHYIRVQFQQVNPFSYSSFTVSIVKCFYFIHGTLQIYLREGFHYRIVLSITPLYDNNLYLTSSFMTYECLISMYVSCLDLLQLIHISWKLWAVYMICQSYRLGKATSQASKVCRNGLIFNITLSENVMYCIYILLPFFNLPPNHESLIYGR